MCQELEDKLTQDLEHMLAQHGDDRKAAEYLAENTGWRGLIDPKETESWNRVVFPAKQCLIFARTAALQGLDGSDLGNWLGELNRGVEPVTTDTLWAWMHAGV